MSFAYRDPRKAQMTVQALMSGLMDANMNRQRHAATAIPQRPDDEIERLRARVDFLEKRLGVPSSLPPEEFTMKAPAITAEVLESPRVPDAQIYPSRALFASTGLGLGWAAAIFIAIFRRQPPHPFPAQTA